MNDYHFERSNKMSLLILQLINLYDMMMLYIIKHMYNIIIVLITNMITNIYMLTYYFNRKCILLILLINYPNKY